MSDESKTAARQGVEAISSMRAEINGLAGWLSDLGHNDAADAIRKLEISAANASTLLRNIEHG